MVGRSSPTAPLAREFQGYGSAVGVIERGQAISKDVTGSSWDRYTAMVPCETDTAVTYRVGRRTARRGASAAHAYTADPSHGKEAGGHGTGSSPPDHYTLLGVERRATEEQIECVYRRRVAQIHPDKFVHDPALREEAQDKLKQLNAAMADLRDPVRRARHDANLLGDGRSPLARRLQGSMPRYLS